MRSSEKTMKKFDEASKLIGEGMSVDDACSNMKLGKSTYYELKKNAAQVETVDPPKRKYKKRGKYKKRAPRPIDIPVAAHQKKIAAIVGDVDDVLSFVARFNQ